MERPPSQASPLLRDAWRVGLLSLDTACADGSALHVMLLLENLIQALLIFHGLRSRHGQRALLVYHYRCRSVPHMQQHRPGIEQTPAAETRLEIHGERPDRLAGTHMPAAPLRTRTRVGVEQQ